MSWNPKKITASQAVEIRADPRSLRALARVFGINQAMVWKIKHGLVWKRTVTESVSPK